MTTTFRENSTDETSAAIAAQSSELGINIYTFAVTAVCVRQSNKILYIMLIDCIEHVQSTCILSKVIPNLE